MSKENIVFTSIAAAGTIITAFLGGWDIALKAMLAFMVADYITGVLAAFKNKTVNSEVMFWGGIRKAAVLLVIAIAVLLDELVGNSAPIFRTAALYFYIAREGLSVVENLGMLGVYIPPTVKSALEQLQKKDEVKKDAI